MNKDTKIQTVKKLLEEGNGEFEFSKLIDETGSHRIARSAIFLTRKSGMDLIAVRVTGRNVHSYKCNTNTQSEVEANNELETV